MRRFILWLWAILMLTGAGMGEARETGPSWKDRWFVSAVWYQIFPDRFYRGEPKPEKVLTEKYYRSGERIPARLSSWEDHQPRTWSKYGGDLKGILEKIPYLKELGINAIWLNPVFEATSSHRYNTSDYRKIDPLLGDEETFRMLVSSLHENGIRIILDGVFNHTGYEFWAFQDIVRNGPSSRYKDWYHIKSFPVRKLWEQDKSHPPNYLGWWGMGSLPKLNYANPEVREYIHSITKYWMETGIDGWRLDVPNEIKYIDFWKEWCALVRSLKAEAYIVGEIWEDGSPWTNSGDLFDAVMNYYGFRDPVLLYFSAKLLSVSQFDSLLARRREIYPHPVACSMLNLLGSHDTSRILTVLENRDRDDHDKKRKGYYKGPVSEETRRKNRVVTLFQFTYVGCPIIYYGDEVGMHGGADPDCRKPMLWDESRQDRDLLSWYRRLIAIRRQYRALRIGAIRTLLADDARNIYAYLRQEEDESILVAFNYSPEEYRQVAVMLPEFRDSLWRDILNGGEWRSEGDRILFSLPSYGGRILLRKMAAK